jgi:sulfatase maturation enzyme AslB (radical SAM superfamily)
MLRKPKLENLNLKRDPFPADIIVETCAFCNLLCVMCPYPLLKRPKGEMTFSTFKKIVDELALESPESRLWVAIMGEPLLRGERLFEMFEYAHDKGVMNTHLNTNATYLTPEYSERLLAIGVKEILISLDAVSKQAYDSIRVGGDFAAVVRNTEDLLALKKERKADRTKVIVQFIIQDKNKHEVEAFKERWLSRGAVVKVRLKCGWGNAVSTEDLDAAAVKRDFACPWLVRTVSIQWDGKFAQCDADYDGFYSPGSIVTQSIREVWNGELAARRESHWALDFNHPLCRTCKDWSVGRADFYNPGGKSSE